MKYFQMQRLLRWSLLYYIAICHKSAYRQFTNSAPFLTQYILCSGCHDNDFGPRRSDSYFNTRISIFGKLTSQKLVEFSFEYAVSDKLEKRKYFWNFVRASFESDFFIYCMMQGIVYCSRILKRYLASELTSFWFFYTEDYWKFIGFYLPFALLLLVRPWL